MREPIEAYYLHIKHHIIPYSIAVRQYKMRTTFRVIHIGIN